MPVDRGLLDRIRARGEEVLTQLSAELMSNPRFVKAVNGALRGREKLEKAAGRALRQMNVSTQGELRRAHSRIDALERQVAELRRQQAGSKARQTVKTATRRGNERVAPGKARPRLTRTG